MELYGTMMDHFFKLGLHLSLWSCTRNYERALRHTIKYYIKNNGFVPSPLKWNVFTVVAKDKIDFNATPSKAVQHFHRNSIIATECISSKNVDNELLPFYDIASTNRNDISWKNSFQTPESYTSLEQLNVQQTKLYYHMFHIFQLIRSITTEMEIKSNREKQRY